MSAPDSFKNEQPIAIPDSKVEKQIDKLQTFDALYPDDQAKSEAITAKKEFTQSEKKVQPEPKTIDIEEINIRQGIALANTDGYKKKTLPTQKLEVWGPGYTLNMNAAPEKGVNIDYETINKQKRRHMSGNKEYVSEEEFLRLPSVDKLTLQGKYMPFLIKPEPEEIWGNIPFEDSNAYAGYNRKLSSFNGMPYTATSQPFVRME